MVLVCNMAFAKSMIHILERMVFELLCTNVLVVGKTGKVLLTLPMYFLQMGNQIFCSVCAASLNASPLGSSGVSEIRIKTQKDYLGPPFQ